MLNKHLTVDSETGIGPGTRVGTSWDKEKKQYSGTMGKGINRQFIRKKEEEMTNEHIKRWHHREKRPKVTLVLSLGVQH